MMPFSRCSLALLSCLIGVFSSISRADFAGASFTVEVINPGEITYKIYLNYTNPLDWQLAVSGNANFSALQLTASSPLIQKHLVPAVPADVPGPLAQPGDSWVTIGEGDANGQETQFSPGFLAGQEDEFGALISGDGFLQADNGGYFDSNPSTQVQGTQILIAQFTFAAGTTWTFTGTSDFNAGGTDLTNAAFSVTNIGGSDCDGNGLSDPDEILTDPSLDCDNSGVLDSCEIADGILQDCNGNGLPDVCYPQGDCNANGIEDSCEDDCDSDGFIDACDLDDDADGILDDPCDAEICGVVIGTDCDGNGLLDSCDIADGANDCDGNGVLDACEADCDSDGLPDTCEDDCDDDGVPDDCEDDCDFDGVPDDCDPDDDGDGIPDECDSLPCGAIPGVSSTRVGAAYEYSAALREDGTIACWGGGGSVCSTTPADVFAQFSTNIDHTLALREDGTIACWGFPGFGQCDAPDGVFSQISAGYWHSMALRPDGTIACWGDNGYGQCDAPDGVFSQISAGIFHSMALREDGTVECWGDNSFGQCNAPDGVFTQISAGYQYSMALRQDGTVACWGFPDFQNCNTTPAGVFTQISAGVYHSMALRPDGTLVCWGSNTYGECDAPDGVFTQISAGYDHSMALRPDGTVACWGRNNYGQCDVPEELQTPSNTQEDCDGNGVLDTCDLADGATDCDGNGILDRCEPDCDGNGVADACDVDCDNDGIPDACDDDDDGDGLDDACDGEICGVVINDADMNGVQDDCEPCSPSLFLPIEVDEIQYNPGEISYRIHLRTPSVFDQVLAVSGDADISMLEFLADAELIQHELVSGTVLGDTPTAGFVLPGDSWVTIGPEGAEDTAFSPGFLGGDGATSVINGSSWSSSDNRGYFDAYPLTQVEGGRVLIAQFTLPEGAKFRYRGSVNFECEGEELARRPFRWSNDAEDCDANGEEDWVDLLDPANDCNSNGVVDICEFGGVNDCDSNGIPDECEPDCDGDGTTDACDSDDDGDGTPDECDADSCGVVGVDCDGNGVLDSCDPDCDGDGTIDACDVDDDGDGIADECDADSCGLTLEDCDGNGVFDGCDPDCDVDGTPDACDLDDDGDGIPDECDADSCGVVGDDCDGNGVLDSCDPDCDTDGVPDACEEDCDTDGVPDDCETDCDADGTPDDCDDDDDDDGTPDDCDADSCGFLGDDCDGDGVLDTCQLDPSTDCDNSGTLDVCDLADDPELDCDANGLLDFCQALEMPESDCDANLIPDTCDQDAGAADENADGILDRCQCGDSGQTLPHPGPSAGESFGRSVDLDGNRAVVGVRDGEACYVFRFDGMNWVFEDFLISEDLDGDSAPDVAGLTNGWGQAVKIAGDSIAVGARLYNIPGTPPLFNAGIVVTFRFDNGAWVEDSRLSPPDQFGGDTFGESLDFEETVLVTSAPGADDSAENAGEIHIFSRSLVDGWQWQQVYRPDGLAAGDRFGEAVAVEGELVVASATGDDDQGPQTGALHVSLRTAGSMIPLDKLYSPEPWASQEYGTELDLQGGRIAAGAPFDNRNGPAQGLVGLHEQDGSGNWTATAIRPENPQDYEYFGASVALDGDLLVVGAPGDDQNPQLDPPPGAVYIFERLGLGDWVQRRRITLPTYPFGELGLASAVDNGRILSGALFDDRYGEDAGLARVFDILPSLDCDADGLCDLSQIFEPEFDCNFNGVVDLCELDAVNDCDGNGVLDVCELDGRDCDDNGVLDSCDLAQGGTDANCDGVLDVCQCLGDLNGSGVISFEDLVVLIAAWGELCPSSCPEDLDCNGVVDSMDLLTILSQWGPCGG